MFEECGVPLFWAAQRYVYFATAKDTRFPGFQVYVVLEMGREVFDAAGV